MQFLSHNMPQQHIYNVLKQKYQAKRKLGLIVKLEPKEPKCNYEADQNSSGFKVREKKKKANLHHLRPR